MPLAAGPDQTAVARGGWRVKGRWPILRVIKKAAIRPRWNGGAIGLRSMSRCARSDGETIWAPHRDTVEDREAATDVVR